MIYLLLGYPKNEFDVFSVGGPEVFKCLRRTHHTRYLQYPQLQSGWTRTQGQVGESTTPRNLFKGLNFVNIFGVDVLLRITMTNVFTVVK